MISKQSEIASLIVATGKGDRSAFETLYRQTSSRLLGIVLRIVRSRPEAEEVVQETYLRIWTSAGGFSSETSSAFGWLVSIARNRAIDVVRARPSLARVAGDSEAEIINQMADPTDVEAHILGRNELAHCLLTLEQPYRDLIVFAYCHGASREELALKFNKPVSTVKTWLHRALPALKSCLVATREQTVMQPRQRETVEARRNAMKRAEGSA